MDLSPLAIILEFGYEGQTVQAFIDLIERPGGRTESVMKWNAYDKIRDQVSSYELG